MSQMVGMDVDQTRQLAAAFTRQAQRLHEIGAELDGLVHRMRWDGPDAEQLRSEWTSSGRRGLAAAQAALQDAGGRLLREVEAQEQASGGAGGATGGGPGGSWFAPGDAVLRGLAGALDSSGYTALSAGLGFAGVIGTVAKNGHYSPLYKAMTGGADFFKYRKAGVVFDSPLLRVLDRNPVMGGLGHFGKGLGVVTSGADLYRAFGPGQQADTGERIGAVGGTAATALKMSKNPVLYLGGVATASVTEAAAAATHVDWSGEGRKQVWDAVVQDPGMVLDELGKATTQVFTEKIWKVLG